MKFCILAAGVGSRMGPLSQHVNKAILPINFKAVLSHIIEKFDDNIESITNRINVYKRQTEPLLEYYQSRELLIIADGNGDIDQVYKHVLKSTKITD